MIKKGISLRWLIPSLISFLWIVSMVGPIIPARAGAIRAQSTPVSAIENYPYLRVLQTSAERIVLEFTPPEPQLETSQIDGQPCQTVHMPGLTETDAPGLPALPVQGAMLGIPQTAQPTLKIGGIESSSYPGSHALCPLPRPVLARSPDKSRQLTGYSYERAPAYQLNGFMPSTTAELVSTGNLRSQRFAEIRLNPLQYNPVSGEVRYIKRMQVELNFNVGQADSLSYVNEGYFEESLRSMLLNYDQARAWRSRSSQAVQPNTITAPQSQPAYKILVNQDGLYQVTYAALQTAGLPVDSLDPRTFQLYNQSVEVATYVEGEADGVFNSTDYLLFYGQKVNTKYTDTNVYWLSWGSATGLRMTNLNGAPTGTASVPVDFLTRTHAEVDTDYFSEEPSGANKDHWYWGLVSAVSGPAYLDFTTDLYHLGSGTHTITVRGLLNGYSASPNHHTKIYLNGNLIDDHSFPAGSEYNFSVNVSQSYLVEGVNTLRVECPHDGSITLDEVLVNWFEIDYYDTYFAESNRLFFDGDQAGTWEFRVDGFSNTSLEAYDVTNPLAPRRITGGSVQSTVYGQQLAFEATIAEEHHYLAQTTGQRLSPLSISLDSPSSWKSTSIGADYILITHGDFLTQVQPLANFRASQGLRVQVVNVQDVYDEFNGGVFSPEAIQSFLAYAYANWVAPAPSFVLLVGDGHFDFKNVFNYNSPTYIPPYLDDVDPWIGETATDNRYVSVSGGDSLPDLYIGRFPVGTTAEAQTMVEKTINYEQIAPVGDWNAKLNFIADNADSGGNFPVLSDQIINTYVPSTYTVDKIYWKVPYTDINLARAAIQAAINAGRLIVHFEGHGSVQQWASEGLLKVSDLSSLTNGSKLPLILPMTCAEGYFIWPSASGLSSLGESIVRINGKGAIASWSPAGYGLSSGHQLLDESLFDDLFNHAYTRLGYLTTNAKYSLYAHSSSYRDLIETYLLFGDPALKLQTLPPGALTAPSNLQASAVSSTQINLTWQDNSNNEGEFQIERSLDGVSGWTQIGSVDTNVTSYSDKGRSCETPYYYRVRAYRAGDAQGSNYSITANASTYACQTINFVPGWNLIALPMSPITAYNAETMLLAINAQGGTCSEVDQWLNSAWNSHVLGYPFGLFSIVMGEGYFVKCTQTSSWTLEGTRPTGGVLLNLVSGWNLVGIPYPVSGYLAHDILNGINGQGGSCSEITRWVNSSWESYIKTYPFNDFTILPAEGYFVKCSASSSYTP